MHCCRGKNKVKKLAKLRLKIDMKISVIKKIMKFKRNDKKELFHRTLCKKGSLTQANKKNIFFLYRNCY